MKTLGRHELTAERFSNKSHWLPLVTLPQWLPKG